MKIEQKLQLSQDSKTVAFISDGLFYGLYNQSAYIVIELLEFNLKLKVKNIRKLNNQKIIMTGIPKKSLLSYFPAAVATEFEFVLHGDWSLTGYQAWWAKHVAQATCSDDHENAEIIDNNNQANVNRVYLTPQQESFIETWERGKYPIQVEIGFLENLKLHVRSIKNKR